MSCCGRNSCISWMSLARSWLSLAMLQISSWLKSGWICLHKSIWLMTLPMFDGPARFSMVYLKKNKINNTYWYIIAIIISQNDWFDFIRVIFFFTNQNIQSCPSVWAVQDDCIFRVLATSSGTGRKAGPIRGDPVAMTLKLTWQKKIWYISFFF